MLKRIFLIIGITLLSLSVFVACSSNSGAEQAVNDNNDASEDGKQDENKEKSGEESENDEADSSAGEFEDQTNLKIGDTGQVETTLGKYEITIETLKAVDEIEGELPALDRFLIAEVTLKNIGQEAIEADDSIEIFELTEDLEGPASEDMSRHFSSIAGLKGIVKPGESVSGEAVFEGREADTYYIRVVRGLLAADAVKNDIRWTFSMDEVEK